MRQIRILEVSFDTEIQPYQLPQFRGAVARKAGLINNLFHNHDNENGGFFNRYPLIQYKIDTYNGQMRPMLLCLEEGIEEAHHFFSQPDWSVNLNGIIHPMRVARMNVNKMTLDVDEQTFNYRLHKWQALNTESYKVYRKLVGIKEKIEFLEKRLSNHIISFASGVNCRLEKPFEVKITNINKEDDWVSFKKVKVMVFTIEFQTNISLPNFIGLGKGSSMGLGVLRRFPKERTVGNI